MYIRIYITRVAGASEERSEGGRIQDWRPSGIDGAAGIVRWVGQWSAATAGRTQFSLVARCEPGTHALQVATQMLESRVHLAAFREMVRTMSQVPAFVTHYHLPDKSPFLNLSDLAGAELEAVLRDLEARRVRAGLRRVFGPRYMELRQLTEARLRHLFIQAGGSPSRVSPHYFVLGECEWYRALSPEMSEVVLPLAALPSNVTSVTYPDSLTALGLGAQFGLVRAQRSYHDRVFRVEQLPDLVATHGLPLGEIDDAYEGYHRREFEKYIEIQVWSDDPIRSFL